MVTLATKCYVAGDARGRAMDGMNSLVNNTVGELDVDAAVSVRDDDFVEVDLSGPDETVSANLLREEWGTIASAGHPDHTVGTLESWDDDGFVFDSGDQIRLPAEELGLGPGTPDQIVERFGLVQHLPMQFQPGNTPELTEAERDRLYEWQRGAGRVNVNSATRGEVRATVNRAGHASDIVTVERLGLLEQSIVCREGTDPPGLLAAIGSYLPAQMRCVV
jgi:Uncharacterized protein conserved in archaea